MAAAHRATGILAGGGGLPLEIAQCINARGQPVHIVALDGEADADFTPFPVTRVNWGQVGAMVKALKAAGCEDLVIVGKVRRPDPSKVRPDTGFFLAAAHILKVLASGGDDGVLRAVLKFFETKGLHVIGAAEAAPELVIGPGALGACKPSSLALEDIALGFKAVEALGPHDVGQGVVVCDGALEAVEAAEGTDAMLDRVAKNRSTSGRRGGVLVKSICP
jgi:UDP-2,3-diacylglucosamine hydrolase